MLSTSGDVAWCLFPAMAPGQIHRVDLFDPRPSACIIQAHQSVLGCLALSQDGRWLASASEKGTVIRVFDVAKNRLIKEFRRGVDRVRVN